MMRFFNRLTSPSLREGVNQYRRTIRVYDIFTFFNELELLEIRLAILAPYVDHFVIVECEETFSGHTKELFFLSNRQRFRAYDDKIIHFIVKKVPLSFDELAARLRDPATSLLEREVIENALSSDNVPAGQVHWLKEFYQKESIKHALVSLADDDVCFVSDVDEIWNPAAFIDYRQNHIFKCRQTVYTYFLNNRSSERWAGTLVTKYRNIRTACLNHLRTASKTRYHYVANGGWHFTNQGGADRIRLKLAAYGHQEFNTPLIRSSLEDRILRNEDFIGRRFRFWRDENGLPQYLLDHRHRYQHMFL
jgi:hypothetical protein